MNGLFNKHLLNHNKNSEAEGAYRLNDLSDSFKDTETDGEKFITLIHPNSYIERIKRACNDRRVLAEIFLTPESYRAACLSVGLTVKASGQNDFALIRPPGHHADREKASGFCLFNNIAIATQRLVDEGKKVFIFDFDGHHGDGTQSIFYNSDRVFYCSIHQMFTWPFTGQPTETGEGDGKGYTLNFPLLSGSGDKEFLERVDKAIDAASKFKPDVVAISAGFDGYEKDRLLNLNYSLKGFYECGFRWRRAFPNIFAVLEGGYHNEIKSCVEHFVDGVNVGSRPPKKRFDDMMSVG
jgi:acetoin utilization deacetylase AcuC-like enzyme